jgi:hypothetical protein
MYGGRSGTSWHSVEERQVANRVLPGHSVTPSHPPIRKAAACIQVGCCETVLESFVRIAHPHASLGGIRLSFALGHSAQVKSGGLDVASVFKVLQ